MFVQLRQDFSNSICCFVGQTTSDDIPLTSLEESLLSLEKLDRASPELWPEQSKFLGQIIIF